MSQGRAPSRGSRGGSFLPLPASGGSRRPWAHGRLPSVSASVFPGLLLCVCVSPLLSLRRTLSLEVGPPSSRRTSSQTLPCITPARTLLPNEVPFTGSGGQSVCGAQFYALRGPSQQKSVSPHIWGSSSGGELGTGTWAHCAAQTHSSSEVLARSQSRSNQNRNRHGNRGSGGDSNSKHSDHSKSSSRSRDNSDVE